MAKDFETKRLPPTKRAEQETIITYDKELNDAGRERNCISSDV